MCFLCLLWLIVHVLIKFATVAKRTRNAGRSTKAAIRSTRSRVRYTIRSRGDARGPLRQTFDRARCPSYRSFPTAAGRRPGGSRESPKRTLQPRPVTGGPGHAAYTTRPVSPDRRTQTRPPSMRDDSVRCPCEELRLQIPLDRGGHSGRGTSDPGLSLARFRARTYNRVLQTREATRSSPRPGRPLRSP